MFCLLIRITFILATTIRSIVAKGDCVSIQKKYINFSFILGGILLLCVSFLYVLSSLNENGSTIVNIAGKQRMLVLRFGKLIIQAKTLNDSSKNLQEDIYSVEQELNSNHNKIISHSLMFGKSKNQ